ncbi:MAG TPA: RIP metalloprotease RseP [Terriglobales bacterium]|jgi:regulator of sigma E protease|nr:RIP metalloprotease RseP [Terriglobales bacterium]
MSGFLIAVLSVVVILGFMILIHEFGHYAVAKFLGVRVEQFAIGFGTRLVGFKKGDTDYRINALPLGGYVKMAGENPMDERTGDPGEFLSHPRWHRFLIAIAGPAMNILLAIGLLTGVYMVHYEYPLFLDQPAVISWVKHDSAAAQAGLQPGDRIIHIDGVDNPTWDQVFPTVMLSPNQPLDVTIQRGDQILQRTIVPKPVTTSEIGSAGWYAKQSVIVGDMEPDMPAAKAGMKEGDKIVAMDGKPLPSIDAMIESLQETKDKPVELTIERGGQQLEFRVQPVLAKTEDAGENRYRIGFQNAPEMKVGSLPFAQAFNRSLEENKKGSLLILELVQKLVRHQVSLRTVEGPIGIGRAAGEAASEKGWTPLLALASAISLNLGIFNLLPIPILDGGVIMLLLVEGVMRRDISLRIKERIYQAAFVFLVLFAVMVIYNDLVKTLPGLAQRLP